MAIEVGADAPNFTLKTQDNEDWTLSAQKGKTVVLMWYPLDWSPTCTTEHCKISTESILTGDNMVKVGISRDSVWSHKAYKEAKSISHDLLADPMLDVTKTFGLEHPAVPFISHRATVIVNADGKVAHVQIQESTGDERDWSEIQEALTKLGTANSQAN